MQRRNTLPRVRIISDAGVMPWDLSDEKLEAQCRFEAFVGSGPGGQKRHKTNAAVRITHVLMRVSAVAADSRSQRENKIHALRELRHKLAIELRREIADAASYGPPAWLANYAALRINVKNPRYPAALAHVLDVMKSMQWNAARSAVMIGVSTSALLRFLHDDPAAWVAVNQERAATGLTPLRAR